jgi:hypothetical protein
VFWIKYSIFRGNPSYSSLPIPSYPILFNNFQCFWKSFFDLRWDLAMLPRLVSNSPAQAILLLLLLKGLGLQMPKHVQVPHLAQIIFKYFRKF